MKRQIITIGLVAICIVGLFIIFFLSQGQELGIKNTDNEKQSFIERLKEDIAQKLESTRQSLSSIQQNLAGGKAENTQISSQYPLHENITSTIFWVGEKASGANDHISNSPSAWDDNWKKHFGGTDSSQKRNGFYPAAFVPKENPFYVALPFNDFGKNGHRKANLQNIIPWANEKNYGDNESMCKNRWVKIIKGSKTVYAQWEDVGPFNENDSGYVFGSNARRAKQTIIQESMLPLLCAIISG